MLDLQIGYEEFLPIWNEIFFAKPEMERFVASLNSGRKLVLLSNVNQLHYEYLTAALPSAFSLFSPDNIIPSFRTGFMKPDREIYQLALAACGVAAEEVVYVDDRADLIAAASGYGIRSLQFKNVNQLRQDFMDLGITE
jgi:HAD superfamily hydrolase (TIGR01509 family)